MRRRWIGLLGRFGTVLLVIGLALLLVSLIPPTRTGFSGSSSGTLESAKCKITFSSDVYSPKYGLQLSVESDKLVYFYLLDVRWHELREWVTDWHTEHLLNLTESDILRRVYNNSALEDYLEAYPESILLEEMVDGEWSLNFFPTKVANATPVFSNPSSNRVYVSIEMKGIVALAARERVLTPAQWLIPIGLLLALPWSYMRIKKTPIR
ncbi:MAG: hypothetical protein ACETVR_04325 [Candidatus Bathyarchaeia archaeon]